MTHDKDYALVPVKKDKLERAKDIAAVNAPVGRATNKDITDYVFQQFIDNEKIG